MMNLSSTNCDTRPLQSAISLSRATYPSSDLCDAFDRVLMTASEGFLAAVSWSVYPRIGLDDLTAWPSAVVCHGRSVIITPVFRRQVGVGGYRSGRFWAS